MTLTRPLPQDTDVISVDFSQIVKINFQPDNFDTPDGYLKDSGQPYSEMHGFGFGWVREDSLSDATPTPLNIAANARDRNRAGIDPQLNTLLHMQYPQTSSNPTAVKIPAAWQCTVPNGTYNVTVSVGDAIALDSIHQINIKGQPVISSFVPTPTQKFFAITKLVTVTDGKLTINASGGTNTKINYVAIAPGNRPSVRTTNIADSQTEVLDETNGLDNVFVDAEVNLPNSAIDFSTLTSETVKLFDTSTGEDVDADRNTTGVGDGISLSPKNPLQPNTKYRFEVTDGLKDSTGKSFVPYKISFTTGIPSEKQSSPLAFERVTLDNVPSKPYSTVTIGPDNQLYAATLTGEILRFPINPDGTVGTAQTITLVHDANGGSRSIVGMTFDPNSTADNLVVWISNNHFWDGNSQTPEWSGKITRLSGSNLEIVQDYVVDLPRSVGNHMTNSIAFKLGEPDVLYVLQGSNTAMGAPDTTWGGRPEQLLTAAVLRVDLSKITSLPLSVKTAEGGTYDPFAPEAPLTIFASGVRNAYDLVWHSNGQLYVPTNGSRFGGNTPATPDPLPAACQNRIDKATQGSYTDPAVPGLSGVNTQRDYLFRVEEGGYYGHPNPERCEWVINGGNPASGSDSVRVSEYPLSTEPDRNYRGIAFDFGLNRSPNGIIEYQSDVFGEQLRGKLLVARFSLGKDIIVLTPGGSNLDIVEAQTDIEGFTNFSPSPLDLTEDTASGNLYVAQLDETTLESGITLLRPIAPRTSNARIEIENLDGVPFPDRLVFSRIGSLTNPPLNGVHDVATLRVKNVGSGLLEITELSLLGPWIILNPVTLPIAIAPGEHLDIPVHFRATRGNIHNGTLTIASNDANQPFTFVQLSGFWQSVSEGGQEPNLSEIVQVFGYQTAIVQSGQNLDGKGFVQAVGDEVLSPYWQPANPLEPITVRQLAAYHTQGNTATLRWHRKGSNTLNTIFTHAAIDGQTLLPRNDGSATEPARGTFAPDTAFGFKIDGEWSDPTKNNQTADQNNGCPGPCGHHVRFWVVKDRDGAVIPNTWLMAMDYSGINYDYNDNVYLITNIMPDDGMGG